MAEKRLSQKRSDADGLPSSRQNTAGDELIENIIVLQYNKNISNR